MRMLPDRRPWASWLTFAGAIRRKSRPASRCERPRFAKSAGVPTQQSPHRVREVGPRPERSPVRRESQARASRCRIRRRPEGVRIRRALRNGRQSHWRIQAHPKINHRGTEVTEKTNRTLDFLCALYASTVSPVHPDQRLSAVVVAVAVVARAVKAVRRVVVSAPVAEVVVRVVAVQAGRVVAPDVGGNGAASLE